MGWKYSLHRTRDGVPVAHLRPASAGSWARRLWYKCSGSHDFIIPEDSADAFDIWSITRYFPASRVLVVSWEDEEGGVTPLYAGVIWRLRYSSSNRTVSVSHEDIWSIWERRFVNGRWASFNDPEVRAMETWTNFSDYSLPAWVYRIVEWGQRSSTPDFDTGNLPIRNPEDNSSGDLGRRYWTYEFTTVRDALSEVPEAEPDAVVDFVPALTRGNRFRWEVSVSTSAPEGIRLNASAPGSPVSDITLEHDATNYASEVNLTGGGSETASPYYYRTTTGNEDNRVHLAAHESRPELTSGLAVNWASTGLFQERLRAAQQIECSVNLGGETGVDPADLELGSRVRLLASSDPLIGEDMLDLILIGFRPDGPYKARLEFSDINGFRG